MSRRINTMYFSPTGTTQRVVRAIEEKLLAEDERLEKAFTIDFTPFETRKSVISFDENDIVVFGLPVIAGRVPNVLLKYLHTIRANGALAIAIVVYGNRNYDDALIELIDILESCDFNVIGAGAFIGEHSFSTILAKGRPDKEDLKIAAKFAHEVSKKLRQKENHGVMVKGERPYRDYYKPRDREGNPVDIRKVEPKTKDTCINCKICVHVCPMNSIDVVDVSKLNGICIKCCACIKKCPTNSKYFDNINFLYHQKELEIEFAERREPEFFV